MDLNNPSLIKEIMNPLNHRRIKMKSGRTAQNKSNGTSRIHLKEDALIPHIAVNIVLSTPNFSYNDGTNTKIGRVGAQKTTRIIPKNSTISCL